MPGRTEGADSSPGILLPYFKDCYDTGSNKTISISHLYILNGCNHHFHLESTCTFILSQRRECELGKPLPDLANGHTPILHTICPACLQASTDSQTAYKPACQGLTNLGLVTLDSVTTWRMHAGFAFCLQYLQKSFLRSSTSQPSNQNGACG